MADLLITKIRTENGDLPIDYNALANLPTSDTKLTTSGGFADAQTVGNKIKEINNKIQKINDDMSVDSNDENSIGAILNSHIQSVVTTELDGHMTSEDKVKLNGIEQNANNYSLPVASSSVLGGVTTTSNVNSTDGFEACPIISGIPYYLKPQTTTVTLFSDGWSENMQTVDVEWVTSNSVIVVSPEPSDDNFTAYTDNGVRCIGQGDNQLTFSCQGLLSTDVVVNIVIII